MDLPESLPARLFLLSYDPNRNRMTGGSYLGYLMRASALTDLYLSGHIEDKNGRPAVASARRHAPSDPFLASVLREVAEASPRRWQHWVRRGSRAAYTAVRDELAERRLIRVEPGRWLGLIPVLRVRMPDARPAKQLAATARRALLGGIPPSQLDPRDGALVALAAAAEVRTAFRRRERRQHRDRIRQLGAGAGPAVQALSKVLTQLKSSAAGG